MRGRRRAPQTCAICDIASRQSPNFEKHPILHDIALTFNVSGWTALAAFSRSGGASQNCGLWAAVWACAASGMCWLLVFHCLNDWRHFKKYVSYRRPEESGDSTGMTFSNRFLIRPRSPHLLCARARAFCSLTFLCYSLPSETAARSLRSTSRDFSRFFRAVWLVSLARHASIAGVG